MRLPNLKLLEWFLLERKITEFKDKFTILQCRREMGMTKEFDMGDPRDAVIVYNEENFKETHVIQGSDEMKIDEVELKGEISVWSSL